MDLEKRRQLIREQRKDWYSVFIGNIEPSVTEAQLRSFFDGCGPIEEVSIIESEQGPRNFGFVRYKTLQDARKAITHMDGWPLKGLKLDVAIANDSLKKVYKEMQSNSNSGSGRVIKPMMMNTSKYFNNNISDMFDFESQVHDCICSMKIEMAETQNQHNNYPYRRLIKDVQKSQGSKIVYISDDSEDDHRLKNTIGIDDLRTALNMSNIDSKLIDKKMEEINQNILGLRDVHYGEDNVVESSPDNRCSPIINFRRPNDVKRKPSLSEKKVSSSSDEEEQEVTTPGFFSLADNPKLKKSVAFTNSSAINELLQLGKTHKTNFVHHDIRKCGELPTPENFDQENNEESDDEWEEQPEMKNMSALFRKIVGSSTDNTDNSDDDDDEYEPKKQQQCGIIKFTNSNKSSFKDFIQTSENKEENNKPLSQLKKLACKNGQFKSFGNPYINTIRKKINQMLAEQEES